MMPDNAAPTCKQGDGAGLVNGTNTSAAQTPCMGQWMAHWMQKCRNSSSKDSQLHTDALVCNMFHQFKGHDSLELVKSKEFKEYKFVRVDMNQRYSFGEKDKSNSAAEDYPLSYAFTSGETSEADGGKFKIKANSSMRKYIESIHDETAFSEKLNTQQLTDSSIKWRKSGSYCCHNLDSSDSDSKLFPMLNFKRKIDTTLASKKKSEYGAVSVKVVKENLSLWESIGTSSLVELVPGSCLAAKKITGDAAKVMTTYEDFLSDNVEDMDGSSSPVIHECKYQKTNMVACIFRSGLTCLDPINNKLACMHNLCSCCTSSKLMITGTKSTTGSISKGLGNSWISLKDGSAHLLGESSPTDIPYSFSTEGNDSEVKNDPSSWLLLNQRKLSNPDGSNVKNLPCKTPECSIHYMSLPESCQNLKSVEIEERFQKFSSIIKYLLVADKMGEGQCLRERTMGDSSFTEVDENTLSKTITSPTKRNYGKKRKSTVPLENFLTDEDGNDWDDTSACLMGTHNEFSTKADTVYNHSFHGSRSLLGDSYSRPQKVIASSNMRNSKSTSVSSAPEVPSRNVETEKAEKREVGHLASTDKATYVSHKEASVSRTESLTACQMVSHVKASDVASSSPLPDHASGSETISRWIKRLQNNHSETHSLCAKRLKKGDDSSCEIQKTCSRIQSHNPLSSGSIRFTKEQGDCGKAVTLSQSAMPSLYSRESVRLWIRRWCCHHHEESQTTSKQSVPPTFQREKLKAPLEKFEAKMPASIGAMALMGKAMNDYRPCRFRREEGSLVWNTE